MSFLPVHRVPISEDPVSRSHIRYDKSIRSFPLSKGKLRTMILLDLCGNKTRIRKYSVIFPEERQYTKERDLVHDNHQYDEDDHNSTADHSFYWFRHKLLLPGSFH